MRILLVVKDFLAEWLYTLCENHIEKVDAKVWATMQVIGPCPGCGQHLDQDGFGDHTEECRYATLGNEFCDD
jgi:hypothetical protein